MNKFLKLFSTTILSFMVLNLNVGAIVNEAGVNIKDNDYNELLKLYSEEEILNLPQEAYDCFKKGENWSEFKEISNYIIHDKYLGNTIQLNNSYNPKTTHQTEYKRISISVATAGDDYFLFKTTLNWLKMPKVRSYDIFATIIASESGTVDWGYVNVNYTSNAYNYTMTLTPQNNEYKRTNKGVSYTLKLPTNLDAYSADLYVYVTGYNKTFVNSTYQHAASSVTLSEAMSHSFDSTGLGGAIKFSNSTLQNKYDKMQGVGWQINR